MIVEVDRKPDISVKELAGARGYKSIITTHGTLLKKRDEELYQREYTD